MTTVGIVTGAASGIGAACARRQIGTADVLLLVDRDADALTTAADLLSSPATRCEPVTIDLTDRVAVDALAARAAALGTLRSVTHAAGISPTMADWRSVLTVDLAGTAILVEALRPLVGPGCAVVCLASMAARLLGADPDPAMCSVLDNPLREDFLDAYRAVLGEPAEDPGTAYSWAKLGVQRLVAREAVAFGAVGARICSVSPGTIDTPMGRQEAAGQPAMTALVDMTPLKRYGLADEIAAVASFLLSDDASFVTGTDVLVDGGVCAAIDQMR